MLIRRSAGPLAVALLVGLAPPWTASARADEPWGPLLVRDFVQAREATAGRKVTIAVVGDGVARVGPLKRALREKDLLGTSRPGRENGTLVASLLVGGGASGEGTTVTRGLVPAATILSVRVYDSSERPGGGERRKAVNWGNVIGAGVRHAADQGADVIAVDPYVWDGMYSNGAAAKTVQAAVAYAREKNAVVVAPTRHQETEQPSYPGASPGVIGVGVVGEDGRRDGKWTSASGAVFAAAPGSETPATGPDGRLWSVEGDLVALAFGTAAAAMVKATYPRLTPVQVAQALAVSARRPGGKGRYDTDLGFGYLNPAGALNEARALVSKPAPAMTAKTSVSENDTLDGDRPDPIKAARPGFAWLGGFGALVVLGLVALGCVPWLLLRGRKEAS
ncbi:S8 family serine peptidase [Actinomadura roseirufa]|uniref:S8 family serine peptidase n=1 Tax=Actinomadura roseirufa TaxID=2094049 RepID=UPI0013F159B2|nr:S8 family serine peptidase [Actinomadura roseirufa]